MMSQKPDIEYMEPDAGNLLTLPVDEGQAVLQKNLMKVLSKPNVTQLNSTQSNSKATSLG